ncbi:MAG: hypothetical protein JST49_13145 [Bacteroidetes bacterium]|nr:hypothetical protein [Bacteroidota bacterium]
MKNILSFLATILMLGFIASPLSATLHCSPNVAFAGLFSLLTIAGIVGFFINPTTSGIHTNSLLQQVWINQLMEKLYENSGHLLRSLDMSAFVNYNTINLGDAGVDPEVLVNNNTYPIDTVERTDSTLTITLDRYRTKNTIVRDAEAVQLAYNKLESVIRGHRSKIAETVLAKATHAWAPAADGAYTPVFGTGGNDRADGSNRKALAVKDIAKARRLFDKLKVPQTGRVLVLCPEHQEDLINADAQLFKAFANQRTGEILQLFGFDVYVSTLTATYNSTTGAKVNYGATAASTDSPSSLFYHENEVMRADGDTEMFSRLRDPEQDGDIVGFSKRFIGIPIRNKYIGSIYSTAVGE